MIIIRNIYLVSVPISGTELLKCLEFSKWGKQQRCLCYVNEVTLETLLRMGADCQVEPDQEIRVWNFQFHPPASREGIGERGRSLSSVTNGQCFNQSCPCNEASINPQRGRVQRVFRLVNTWRYGDSVSPKEGRDTPCPFPYLVLGISFIWLFLNHILL